MSRQGRPKSERKQRTRKESFLPSEKIKVMCEAVRQDMGERGITVEDVVKDTGFSLNSVKRYLCSTITESFILKYCEVYNTTYESLYDRYCSILANSDDRFGSYVQNMIKKSHVELVEFADRIGYTPTYILKAIRENGKVTVKFVEACGREFHVNTWELYRMAFETGKLEPAAEDLRNFILAYERNYMFVLQDSLVDLFYDLLKYKYITNEDGTRKVLTINLVIFLVLYIEYMEGNENIERDMIYYAKNLEEDRDLTDIYKGFVKEYKLPFHELAELYRNKFGFSYDDMAYMLGMTRMSLYNLLVGDYEPYPRVAMKTYYAAGLPPVLGFYKLVEKRLPRKAGENLRIDGLRKVFQTSMLWEYRGKIVDTEFLLNVVDTVFFRRDKISRLNDTPIFTREISEGGGYSGNNNTM